MKPLPLPPRIETARLVLRPWTVPDADALHAALGESVEHLLPWIPWATPRAPTLGETRALLGGWIAQRESGENFMYAIFRSDTGRLVGGIGLYARVGPGRLEIGYWLRRTAAGFGYATEATSAITAAGFDVPGVEGLEIHTDPRNEASIRIPVKLGYRRLDQGGGEARDEARATVIFVLERGPERAANPTRTRSRPIPLSIRTNLVIVLGSRSVRSSPEAAMRSPTPLPRASLCLAGLLATLPALATAQTATVRRTVILHADSAVTSRSIERLDPGTSLSLLSADHPNGYFDVRAPDDSAGWVYMRYVELDGVTSGPSFPIHPGPGVNGSAQTEGCGHHLWQHVYNPSRLLVRVQCVTVTGTIEDPTASWKHPESDGVRHEGDGDTHGWIKLDPQFADLLDAGNMSDEKGNLVFELVCHYTVTQADAKPACQDYHDSTAIPPKGTHVRITGTFVQDDRHAQWNEIHPVSKIEIVQQ